MPGECRGADRGGLSIGAVLKRHVPRCSRGVGTDQLTPRDAKVATRNAETGRDRTGSLIPEPKAAGAPRLARRLIGGMRGGAELERAPAQPCPLGERAGCGRPPSPGARVRHSASGPRRRRAGRGRGSRDSRAREGRDAPGRWAIGGRRPRERDGAPPQGTRRHRELHGAPLDMGIAARPQRSGTPAAASLLPAQATNSLTAEAVRQRCPARQRRPRRHLRKCRRYHATAASSRTPPCRSCGTRIPYHQFSSRHTPSTP